MLIVIGVGCGDETNTLPWDDSLGIFPKVYDLSNPARPYVIEITFAPFDEQGNPYGSGSNALIWLNDGAEGYLSLEDHDPGFMMAIDFTDDDGSVNCWYVPSNREETVTIYASADQYPHTNYVIAQIFIINQVIDAKFAYDTTNLAVYFLNDSVPNSGGTLTYSWDFGDGFSSTAENPTHTYAAAGTYRVELVVTDGAETDSTNFNVTVTAAP